MLPVRPSPRAVGGPPPRSQTSRSDRDHATRRYGSSDSGGPSLHRSRQNTTANSGAVSGRERSRSRSRPRASTPDKSHPGSSHRAHGRHDPLPRDRTTDGPPSAASSSTSLLERMRAGRGYSSPRSSMDEQEERPRQGRPSQGRWLKEGRMVEKDDQAGRDPEGQASSVREDGYSIWDRVATAASTLTGSVSKAWQANVTTHEGDETPPGQESRLTRAMRAYHLEKAKDPSDLPEWLFSEQERRPTVRSRFVVNQSEEANGFYEEDSRSPGPAYTGLRDIYAAAAAAAGPTSPTTRMGSRSFGEDGGGPSKATDRLKALRDAKRNAVSRQREDDGGDTGAMNSARRVGLPSRPGLERR